MSAGLPGLGLGGLFFVISALLAPLFELPRLVRGESSAAAWRQIGRQFAMALAMIVAVDLALRALLLASGGDASGAFVIPVAPISFTAGLLVAVLMAAKGAELLVRLGRYRRAARLTRARCPQPCACCNEVRV